MRESNALSNHSLTTFQSKEIRLKYTCLILLVNIRRDASKKLVAPSLNALLICLWLEVQDKTVKSRTLSNFSDKLSKSSTFLLTRTPLRFYSKLSFKVELEKIQQELVQVVPFADKLSMYLPFAESTKQFISSAKEQENLLSVLTSQFPSVWPMKSLVLPRVLVKVTLTPSVKRMRLRESLRVTVEDSEVRVTFLDWIDCVVNHC